LFGANVVLLDCEETVKMTHFYANAVERIIDLENLFFEIVSNFYRIFVRE